MSPEDVVEIVKESGLRGRGGAGFPTGLKWSFMPKDKAKPHYLLCNADESEPGTFKDRELLRWVPHQLIEGCLIGAYAMSAEHVYIYCRGEFFEATEVLAKAVEDAYEAGILGEDVLGSGRKIEVTVFAGAGAYICGEETGPHELSRGTSRRATCQATIPGRRGRLRDGRQRSTTSRLSPRSRTSSGTAQSGTANGARRRVRAPSCSA